MMKTKYRIAKVLFCMGLPALLMSHSVAEAQRLSIQIKNGSLTDLFKEIRTQTKYDFIYDNDVLRTAKKINVSVKDGSVDEILKHSFEGQALTYTIDKNMVVVKLSPTPMDTPIDNNREDKQQKGTFSGRILDKDSMKPISGATISYTNGNRKGQVQTDINGHFTISELDKGKVTYTVTMVGYGSQTSYVDMGGGNVTLNNIHISMASGELDQVVVMAYGTSKVRDLTGSLAHLGANDMRNAPMGASIQSMLQGKAAGVNVMIQSASPSSPVSVIIRGASSLSGDNQPLWVIDGVPQYNNATPGNRVSSSAAMPLSGNIANTLYNLNLNDVESIDVLKDASATAIYGSRGASGVVLVTTKRGREGMKPTVEFSSRFGQQFIDKSKVDVLVADQYIGLSKESVKEAIMTVGGLDYFTRKYIDEAKFNSKFKNTSHMSKAWITDDLFRADAFSTGNTDWWDLMTHNAVTQDYSLSLRGGTSQSSYYTSVFMKDQDGVVRGGNSKTYGLRFNFETTVRDVLKMGINVNSNYRKTNDKDGMLATILEMRPDIAAYNPDGSINRIDSYIKNPLLELQDTNEGTGKTAMASLFLEYDIMKNLKLRTTGNIDYSNAKKNTFKKSEYLGNLNSREIDQFESTALVWENTLNYFETIGKHDINALAGFSMEESNGEGFVAAGQNFPDEDILIDLGSAAVRSKMTSAQYSSALISGFSRINYKFDNKYLLTGTIRRDGSSRFGPDRRWGFFPSAALAWIVSEEPFLKQYEQTISYLKVRASMGKTGSQNLKNYDWQTLMGSVRYNNMPGIIPSTLGNDVLQWESQNQIDVGIDYGFLNDRIRGSLGWYQKKVNNLLYSDPVPLSSSFETVTQNIGGIKNNGLEFDIKADVLRTSDLTLTFDLNVGHNVSRLQKLNSNATFFGGTANDSFRVDVGGKLGDFYGYKSSGRLFRTQEEIIALKPLSPTGLQTAYRDSYEGPGDVYIMDLNGDGKIDINDRTYLGNSNPDVYGGFGSTLIWKNFFFNATFSYALGGERMFELERRTSGDMNVYNVPSMALDSWTMLGNAGTLPRITYYGRGENGIITDRYLHNASFVRLSALNLAYRLPEHVLGDKLFKTIEFTFQGTNLFTITKYPGFDPQGNFNASTNSLRGMGLDLSTYPMARTFSLGVKLVLQ